jgi:WD40 repeat protein
VLGFVNNAAALHDVASGKGLAVFSGHTNRVTSAAFSPDGKRVATTSADGTVRLWDAETAKEIAYLQAHKMEAASVNYHPGGLRIITTGGDNTAKLWDTEWAAVYGAKLRERVCNERLANVQEFTDAELTDPILADIRNYDLIARNPCLRRGPFSLEYWSRLPGSLLRTVWRRLF